MAADRSKARYSSTNTDSIWSHYRCSVNRIARELSRPHPFSSTSYEESENSPQYLDYRVPAGKNKMSVTYRRTTDHSSLKQINGNLSVDHNSNRYRDGRLLSRSRHSSFSRQLSLDLEEARSENIVLRRLLDERSETITKMRGEMNSLEKKIQRLSAGRHSERSKWNGGREEREGNERIERHESMQSVSLSELSPVMSRKDDKRRQSSLTYSSQTPETSSLSTPKGDKLNTSFLPPLPLPNRVSPPINPSMVDRVNRLQPLVQQPSSSSTPKRTIGKSSSSDPTDEESTPKKIFNEGAPNERTPSYYLKRNHPSFILRCERRQTAIKVAAATRAKLEDERRSVARAVVEGKASLSTASPFLRIDPTRVKAFNDESMRRATKKRFRSTNEFQSRVRERNEEIERAANQLIAKCFSANTLRRSRSFGRP